ncbi:BQ5605_C007g04851 [Microbotryum silenes-dioicae]|uniref:BQ5605_C007g04851 protein n=1 Tax=Microbotryum silenes-dioicae TaxID=796604 RepID=A0A2X0N288_9BASI|nr:BQ5605_C007g04851 [Microbotryum silenes-dioicae]
MQTLTSPCPQKYLRTNHHLLPIYDSPGLYSCRVGGPSNQAPSQKHDVIAWLSLINNHLDLM